MGKKQVVEPDVSRKKFDDEFAEFLLIESDWRKKGVICLEADFPTMKFMFIAAHGTPKTVAFGVSIDFANFDVDPPSISFIDPFSFEPVTAKDMTVGFFQIITLNVQQIQIPGLPPGTQQMQQRHPILMTGKNDIPFLCIQGVREYHHHPAHTNDPWLNYRGTGIGKLSYLLDQMYNHSIAHITGFNVNFQFGLKQF